MTDINEILGGTHTSALIRRIESGLSALTGPAYFDGFAERLHNLLGAEYILVCELLESEKYGRSFKSLVFLEPSRQHQPVCYPALSTPCECTVDENEYVCESGVAKLFPQDPVLSDWGAESYYGIAVKNGAGEIQGHIAVLFTFPVTGLRALGPVLKPFLPRISAETGRLRTELHLKQYRDIVSFASDMIAVIGSDYTYQLVNPAYCKALALNPEDLLGKMPTEIFSAETYQNVVGPSLQQALRGETVNVIRNLSTAHRKPCYVNSRITPIAGPGGQISGALVCASDISAIKQSELEQQHRANILEGIAQSKPLTDLLIQITESVCTLAGEAVSVIWYQAPDGSFWKLGASAGLAGSVLQSLQQKLAPQTPGTSELTDCGAKPVLSDAIANHSDWSKFAAVLAKQNLNYFWTTPICSANYQTLGELVVFSECPQQSDAITKVLKSIAPLTAIAIEQHRDKTNRENLEMQLRQAQKMEAIGQLTGGIAHDFNNILGSILGFSGLASVRCKYLEDDKLALYLQEISHAGERARDLISQMLTYSRSGLHSPVPLALAPLIGKTLGLVRPMFPSSISFNLEIEFTDLYIYADPAQLEQVIINLCINARDSITNQGLIKIRLREQKLDTRICASCHSNFHGQLVELTISDNGNGIEDKNLQHIFEPFFSTKEIGKGSGMGLPMVHGIIHEYGGHIVVDSNDTGGTTIRLSFPRYTAAKTRDVKTPESIHDPATNGAALNILIVDDEEALILFYRELLTDAGFEVNHAITGETALDLFHHNPQAFDLVVTDMTMPEMSGLELARTIHRTRPDLPVILCTGFTIDRELASEPSIRRFLRKPVDQADLLAAVSELLDQG